MKPTVTWHTVASAPSGSATYSDIVRWADTLKGRSGGPILFTFSHEPESHASDRLGSSADFVAAYRRVHEIFVARGVNNVEYTWNMTAYAFKVPVGDGRYAAKWYPGDAYVDNVGADAYNWFDCGAGNGKWVALAQVAADALAFAKSHGKLLVLPEWASQRGSQRAQWLKDARNWLLANRGDIRGVFYYTPPAAPKGSCSFALTTQAEFDAFGQMARDRANFGG